MPPRTDKSAKITKSQRAKLAQSSTNYRSRNKRYTQLLLAVVVRHVPGAQQLSGLKGLDEKCRVLEDILSPVSSEKPAANGESRIRPVPGTRADKTAVDLAQDMALPEDLSTVDLGNLIDADAPIVPPTCISCGQSHDGPCTCVACGYAHEMFGGCVCAFCDEAHRLYDCPHWEQL
ncbi:hypothetical protein Tdes44962_MAKER07223 [Teratosphaeria destructans]|uniref:Uncharacterized protein n=1 Tax=Teratosphaeria destructans TaxID=418781 RepID=A0A9W7SZF7_9PEZI|nr:hypothetical protein Tdes44962_MAKER07223 [Teratosphaeria destructans]